ncbi:unnamed protein product [Sphagnum jensenii]
MTVTPYEPKGDVFKVGKQTQELPGLVLIKMSWKSGKDGKKQAHDQRGVYVRPIHVTCNSAWQEFLDDAIVSFQQKLIHKFVTEELDNGNESPVIPTEYMDKDFLLEVWIEQQENAGSGRGKLSAESIGVFFDTELVVSVGEKLSASIPRPLDMTDADFAKIVQQKTNSYRSLFMKLAKQDFVSLSYLNNMEALLSTSDTNDVRKARLARSIKNRKDQLLAAEEAPDALNG